MTLFVTAFLDLRSEDKSVATRLAHFRSLASTGIPLLVFASLCYQEPIEEICREHTNARIHRILELEETWTYSECVKHRLKMPAHRKATKDTFEFLTLMNAKVEFVEEIARGCREAQIAWIDFNVWHVVKDADTTTKMIQAISRLSESEVCVPGCWPKADVPWNRICWRFCGGFLFGGREAILAFAALYRASLPRYLEENGLTWEVNVWARMEQDGWTPRWYKADHDDSLFAYGTAAESM